MPRRPTSPDRRAAQFVLARLHDHLTRLLAPIIPHTAEESWDYRPATPDKPAERSPGGVPRGRPRVGRRRARCPLGRAAQAPRANLDRARRSEEEQADRQRPGGQGPDRHQPAGALAAGSRAAGDALHRLGGRDRRRPRGRRRVRHGRAISLRQVRAVLELSADRRPERRPSARCASGACGCLTRST